MSDQRPSVRLAVYCVFRDGDKVLLSLRQGTGWKDGWWSLVAGHVEDGEAAEVALVREAKEEAGATPVDYRHVYTLHRVSNEAGDYTYIDLFFECTSWQGDITNNEPDKCGELRWVDIHDLPEQTLGYVRKVLGEYSDVMYGSTERS